MNDIAEGTTTVPTTEAPERLAEILERVVEDKERMVLTRADRPVAALVPI